MKNQKIIKNINLEANNDVVAYKFEFDVATSDHNPSPNQFNKYLDPNLICQESKTIIIQKRKDKYPPPPPPPGGQKKT